MRFENMNFSSEVIEAIKERGYEEATLIQKRVIPFALQGKDIVGQSPTGSGKTAAFALPIIQNMNGKKGVQALILAPTRELALQITDEIRKLGRNSKVKAITVYGGQPIQIQFDGLKNANIVIGTPGRILDHLRRGSLKLNSVKFLVLDEADRMLDMGFIDDIKKIIYKTSRERQTMFFGATIPKELQYLCRRFMKDYTFISVNETVEKPKIEDYFVEVGEKEKFQLLLHLLEKEDISSAIIFTNTRKMTSILAENLKKYGIDAEAIHGELTQKRREFVLQLFRRKKVKILVATDVASRGLDISNVSHIINYDIPSNPEDYVHRIGRTARAGKKGEAISLLSVRDHDSMRRVAKFHRSIERREFKDFRSENYPRIDFSLKPRRKKRRLGYRKFSKW